MFATSVIIRLSVCVFLWRNVCLCRFDSLFAETMDE